MLEFTDNVVGKAVVETPVTENDIETILVTAIEGGIGYWARLENVGELWDSKPKGEPVSTWATKLIIEGKEVEFLDEEDNKLYQLTLNKLIKGIELNSKNRPHDSNIDEGDVITADCIVQYALFGELVYG